MSVRNIPQLSTFMALAAIASLTSACASNPLNGLADRLKVDLPEISAAPDAGLQANRFAHNDPVLSVLITQIDDSPEFEQATARLREAQALLRGARAGLLPSITAQGVGAGTLNNGPDTASLDVQLGLSVPIDVFGGENNRTRAVLSRFEETNLRRDTIRLASAETIAQGLVTLRGARSESALHQRQLGVYDRLIELEAERRDAGLETGRPREGTRQRLGDTSARLAALAQVEADAIAAIEQAVGAKPGTLNQSLARVEAGAQFTPNLIELDAVRASQIESRPDVWAEAKALSAAVSEQAAARADRWPRLTLGALLRQFELDGGFSGGGAGFTPSGTSLGVTANVLAPIFDFGRLKALEGAARARADGQAARYRGALLAALSEVSVARAKLTASDAEQAARQTSTNAANRDLELATARQMAGLTTGIPVREAQLVLLERQLAEANTQTAQASAAYSLANRIGLLPR